MKPIVTLPPGFAWRGWIRRWDRMQERYIPGRTERFALMTRLIRETQRQPRRIADLGCGPGSLTMQLLRAFPRTQVIGMDVDPTLLVLARQRLARFGRRAQIVDADLRHDRWTAVCPGKLDAVVSATALHWLGERSLRQLYRTVARQLRPGGIFLNADHVGNQSTAVQAGRDNRRRQALRMYHGPGEAWDAFFDRYLAALGGDAREVRTSALGKWTGIEPGLPLAWHFTELRRAGFAALDCYWRCETDAVYGGIRT